MAKKNFMAYGDAETIFTEYAGALNRKLNCFSGTREEFLALSVEERKKYEYVLDPTSDVVVYAVMDEVDDNTLSFTNNVATVSIPGLTAKSKIWVFYSDESYDVAKAADISVTSGNGVVTFTAANTPTDTIVCDILYYLKKDTTNFASVAGGGGHTIQDEGVDMAQEDALNFIDHDISDDSANGATVVKTHRLTSEELDDICDELPDAPTVVGNVRMTKLWENPDPTQNFAAQVITLSSGDFDLYQVILYGNDPKGSGCVGYLGSGFNCIGTYSYNIVSRHFASKYNNDPTKIQIGDCQRITTYGSAPSNANNIMIPYRIYGIKLL